MHETECHCYWKKWARVWWGEPRGQMGGPEERAFVLEPEGEDYLD